MTETDCPSRELLSAYVDREANPSEERRVGLHLADCSACRAQVRALTRLKVSVRNQPLPAMPAELRKELLAAARAADRERELERAGPFDLLRSGAWLEALSRLLPLRAYGPGWAAAAAALLVAIGLGAWRVTRAAGTPVPVDFILAAHNQYVRTMPVAPTEKIMAELPVQISYAAPEEAGDAPRDVY